MGYRLSDTKYAVNVRIQAFVDGTWKNAWIEENLPDTVIPGPNFYNEISLNYQSLTPSPTSSYSPSAPPSQSYEEITSATGWRVWAPDYDTYLGWVWDVNEIQFYDNLDCTGSMIDISGGTPIDSNNAGPGWGPQNAFDDNLNNVWGGRPDSDGIYFIGMDFGSSSKQVKCLKLYRLSDTKYAVNVRIQAFVDGTWKNAWIEENLPDTVIPGPNFYNKISLDYESSSTSPSASPSTSSSTSPSQAPVDDPLQCNDSTLKFKIQGIKKLKTCSWVGKKKTDERCQIDGVKDTCPVTCKDYL